MQFSVRILAGAMALTMAAALASCASKQVPHEPQIVDHNLVFNKGDYDSKFYRIPALDVTPKGTVVALADKRIEHNGDLPAKIDVVCRTSTDNGLTWGPYITVAEHNEDGGYGDPAMIVDQNTGDIVCVATHGQGLWQAKPENDFARIVVMRSNDEGQTWSEPVDITDQIYSNDGANGTAAGITAFASSGRMLQTKEGRIMFVLVSRMPKDDDGYTPLYAYVVYSDDGGNTWQAVPTPADKDADESKIVQLPDGSLLMSIRNRRAPGARKLTRSTDGGLTWSEAVVNPMLVEPACNGDIIAVQDKDGNDVLLHTLPYDPKTRQNVTLLSSTDGGNEWAPVIAVCPGRSAYSSIAMLPDGTLGCLTEEEVDDEEGGFQLWFSKIEL